MQNYFLIVCRCVLAAMLLVAAGCALLFALPYACRWTAVAHIGRGIFLAAPAIIVIASITLIITGPTTRHRAAGIMLSLPVLLFICLVIWVGFTWGRPVVKYQAQAIIAMDDQIAPPGLRLPEAATNAFY